VPNALTRFKTFRFLRRFVFGGAAWELAELELLVT
jgi:hypothetical protein